jgi:hypothetical protein
MKTLIWDGLYYVCVETSQVLADASDFYQKDSDKPANVYVYETPYQSKRFFNLPCAKAWVETVVKPFKEDQNRKYF